MNLSERHSIGGECPDFLIFFLCLEVTHKIKSNQMGAWGYEEHENDSFRDFIEDDESQTNLMNKLKIPAIRYNPKLIVGIVNLLNNASMVPRGLLQRAKQYLQREITGIDDSDYGNKALRLQALNAQLANIQRLLSRRRSTGKKRRSRSTDRRKRSRSTGRRRKSTSRRKRSRR